MSTESAIGERLEEIRIEGLVQGVGFRPTVWRYANELYLKGDVINDGAGVLISVCATEVKVNKLVTALLENPPPLANIKNIKRCRKDTKKHYEGFRIVSSVNSLANTDVGPDAATCAKCVSDIFDISNRRHSYPFTNCTHCGPRISIIKNIPYDRKHTSMNNFVQCASCKNEYIDPLNRRFHAQPNACADCGPKLWICDSSGDEIEAKNNIKSICHSILDGHIIALKGVGGFQLVCDATSVRALDLLRQRKKRPSKPFALMAKNIKQILKYCELSANEEKLLSSSQAPIVLLKKKKNKGTGISLPNQVAPDQKLLGFMLPYSPLHHLLFEHIEIPLVVTSGNISNEPPCIDNTQAVNKLSAIADLFLLNNREIVNRLDDSVVRFIRKQPTVIRRARGYAPSSITLPQGFSNISGVIGCGAELKNTFCLIKEGKAILSPHIGNLESSSSYDDYQNCLALYKKLFQFNEKYIAVDMHPEYLSSKYGREQSKKRNIPLHEIQHHHAHIAACMVENGWDISQGSVIGIALDGLGFGTDETIWGGEFLVADYLDFKRLGSIAATPMIGGVKSILEPWRNTVAHLMTHCGTLNPSKCLTAPEILKQLKSKPIEVMTKMIEKKINCPESSSCGRLFDAVAAILGICFDSISYEGQAAIELENIVERSHIEKSSPYPFEIKDTENGDKLFEISLNTFWRGLMEDLNQNIDAAQISANFHMGLCNAVAAMVTKISHLTDIKTVALSGGVFQNKIMLETCFSLLTEKGFEVLEHKIIPANDGGVSLGQAAIAAARIQRENKSCV